MSKENLPPGVSFKNDGEGRLGPLIQAKNWSDTSIGAKSSWSETLTGYVKLILNLPTPAIIFWGSDQVQIYNDGYAVIMGSRHPRYLGATYRECWPETYPTIFPWMQRVLQCGEVVHVDRTFIPVTRHGFKEEAFFTFSLSQLVDDDGKAAGILQIVNELTDTVLAERRLTTLRTLTPNLASQIEMTEQLMVALSANRNDIRFALLFLPESPKSELALACSCGVKQKEITTVQLKELSALATSVFQSNHTVEISDVKNLIPILNLEDWHDPSKTALALPITRSESESPRGVLILGVSPNLRFDQSYREFFYSIAREVASSLSVAEERTSHLKSEEEREGLHRFFTQAPVAICVLEGPDHIYRLANDGYYALLGGKRNIIGKPIRKALPEIEEQGYFEILDRVYRTGEPFAGRDTRATVSIGDGQFKEFFIDFTYQPRRDSKGQVDGIVAVVIDVTERKKAELALTAAMEEAQLANLAKTRFLANMSHEIRTPLGVIQGFADLALDLAATESDKANYLNTIKRNAQNLTKLLGEILDLSKIEAGKIEIEKLRFSLVMVVEEVIAFLNLQAKEKGIALRLELEGLVPEYVTTDPTRLRQILINLIGNSIKFTERGHVLVKIKTIPIGEGLGLTAIQFSVADTGIGMTAEQQERLFQPFSQADSSMTRKFGGTGLGLSLSKRLAQALGGDLELSHSERDHGSVFTVTIDVGNLKADDFGRQSKHNTLLEQSVDRDSSSPLQGLRILVVEDSHDNQLLFTRYLKQSGAEVDVAGDGRVGVARAIQAAYDIILMDIQMPGMDGYEATAELRREGYETPIIALTAHALREERDRALRAGFTDYLTKPLNRSLLIETILTYARK